MFHSAGLDLTKGENEGCSSSLGQIYARAAEYNGRYAIMYSVSKPIPKKTLQLASS